MLIVYIIVGVSRNADGSLQVNLSTVDQKQSLALSLPQSEAQNAYIGRSVSVRVDYTDTLPP